jgi:Winged helix DNA-binding domain
MSRPVPRAVVAQRLGAQLLGLRSASTAAAAVDRLLAVQAQDLRGAQLALRARTRRLTLRRIAAAFADGGFVVSWLNRGTLHLVRRDDYWWLHALTAPQSSSTNARRLREEKVRDPDRAVAAVAKQLAAAGPLTRQQLAEKLSLRGQALVHVLMRAALDRVIVRGPLVADEQAYVLVREWLGKPPRIDPAAALAELARRYLAGHGPADARDLAKWSGLPLRDANAAVAGIASELQHVSDGLVALKRRAVGGGLQPHLLGPFDPLLHGWVSREPLLGRHAAKIVSGGVFRSFALVDGRAVATWTFDRGRVVIRPLEPFDERTLAAEIADVERFIGRRRDDVAA